jgi:hypothetical protein
MKYSLSAEIILKAALAIVLLIVLSTMMFRLFSSEIDFREQGRECIRNGMYFINSANCPDGLSLDHYIIAPEKKLFACCK